MSFNTEQAKQALLMRREGKSLKDIAEEFNTDSTAVATLFWRMRRQGIDVPKRNRAANIDYAALREV